jgi:hypothetical protein
MSRRLLFAALLAAVAIVPASVNAAKHSSREKSRAHKTRSEKAAHHRGSKESKRQAKGASSNREEFDRQWEHEQVEPDLPESE